MELHESIWTPHALEQLEIRGLDREVVTRVLAAPERVEEVRPGRVVASATASFEVGSYPVRVFVDVDRDPFEIVTAYRTSKIRKYGSPT